MSKLRLLRPPIVEAWLEFHMDAAENEEAWCEERVKAFVDGLDADFCEHKYVVKETIQIADRHPSGQPREIRGQQSLDRTRSFDQDRGRCIQAGQSFLVSNLVRRGEDYPGFEELLDQSLKHFEHYVRIFRPQRVRDAALHYTDLVRIPRNREARLNLDEYFRIGVSVPDKEEWPVTRFAAQMEVPIDTQTGHHDSLTVNVESRPADQASEELRVKIDWHAACGRLDTLDPAVLRERLARVREATWHHFQQSVTPRLWSMFQPSTET